jgi:hypothetical protein
MGVDKTVEIAQILFFSSGAEYQLAGPALLAVCDEVRRFYAPHDSWLDVPLGAGEIARVRPSLATHCVSSEAPTEVPTVQAITDASAIDRIVRESAAGPALSDHAVLGPLVHELVDSRGMSVVVTDLEIVPPAEWRYMIWDASPNGAVISVAPLDPAYWAIRDVNERDRLAIMKARARAALLTVVGSLLGIGRCRNDRCFMLANVDSVERLDRMACLGPEHGITELAGRTFTGSADPAQPEEIAFEGTMA